MSYSFFQLRYAMDEVERLNQELGEMCEAWESDDPCAQACNDPGLQFEKGEELERAVKELKELMTEFLKEDEY